MRVLQDCERRGRRVKDHLRSRPRASVRFLPTSNSKGAPMQERDGQPGRRQGMDVDAAESRRLARVLAARRALATRVTAGPKRKQGSPYDRAAHLTDRHD